MFFFFAIVSILGYSVQSTLLAKYAREMDNFSVTLYRHLSLVITMLPLLFLVDVADILALPQALWPILAASFFGAMAELSYYMGIKSLPVGIASAFSKLFVVFLLLWAYLFFGETISLVELGFVGVILGGILFLGRQKYDFFHLDGKHIVGVLWILAFAFLGSLTFFFVGKASRQIHPLVVGYFWEAGIGMCVVIFALMRSVCQRISIERICVKRFVGIGMAASGTVLGTGAYAMASALGPLGIIGAINSAGVVSTTLLSHYLYHEKLSKKQWLGIWIVVMGIIGLKLAGA